MENFYEADAPGTEDLYYVDTMMYDTPEYGSVYILDSERPAIVDSGTGHNYETILAGLDEVGIDPEELGFIALTHIHLDHAGGASILAQECPNATVCIHDSANQFLRDPTKIWAGTEAVMGDRIRYYREPDPIPEDRIRSLSDGDTVDLGDHELAVHHAPGHAFHQVVYHDTDADGVFTADAAGVNVPHREGVRQTSPPSDFDFEQCIADVELLKAIDPAALYYGHFGDRATDGLLDEYEDVLESWVREIEEKREELDDDQAVIDYFVERTEMVEDWGKEHAHGEDRMNVQGVLQYLDSA
jgi:glyoxylase-like metal-dependent hydrolase (beta-lactamase superfamily II)